MTNYSVGKPSYAFSASTTEFDDALIQRGIVTTQEALQAKGMSKEEAQRLLTSNKDVTEFLELKHGMRNDQSENEPDDDLSLDDHDNDDDDDDDDEFLQEYRQKRIAEMQHAQTVGKTIYGEPIIIDRTDWTKHVNEDSLAVWVVVCLTSSDTERTGCLEQAIHVLAAIHRSVKFVFIAAHSAIPNWPTQNLPSLFLYRDGRMQHELLRLPIAITESQLEEILRDKDIISEN